MREDKKCCAFYESATQTYLIPPHKSEYRAQKTVVFQKYCGNESEDPTLIGDFKMRAPPVRILI